jgi:hypothetical protein
MRCRGLAFGSAQGELYFVWMALRILENIDWLFEDVGLATGVNPACPL